MRSASRLKGFGLIQMAVLGLLLGFGALFAFKAGKPYADERVLRGIVEKALIQAKDQPELSSGDVGKMIFDRANVQSITLDYEAIDIKSAGEAGQFSVHIDMVTRIPLWPKAFLVLENVVDETSK
jgi:hypothetical protein